jgi:hypothetical protein
MDAKHYLRSILSERQLELLEANVITVHIDFFGSGTDVYARVVNPHHKLGLEPHESYSPAELENALRNIQVGRRTYEGMIGPQTGPRPSQIDRSDFDIKTQKGIVTEIAYKGVSNLLPDKSLTYKELALLNSSQLFARMVHVVNALGQDKLVSRIETNPTVFGPLGPGLRSWWSRADELSKFKLLSNAKQAGTPPADHRVFIKTLGRLKGAQCPFRDFNDDLEEDPSEEEDGGASLREWFSNQLNEGWP